MARNHEPERIVIESGILAVALLFAIPRIRGLAENVAFMGFVEHSS